MVGVPAEARVFRAGAEVRIPGAARTAIESHAFSQYLFFGQWRRVKAAVAKRGLSVIGDVPIFGRDGQCRRVVPAAPVRAGRGDGPAARGRRRAAGLFFPPTASCGAIRSTAGTCTRRMIMRGGTRGCARPFELYDIVRIDHFRGFADYWRIPWPATTARKGAWRPGPGLAFFESSGGLIPAAKIIAEDLGELSVAARQLRRDSGLPGMAILQFAFGGKPTNPYLPHNLKANSVIYPGTHDNDTTLGWYATADERTRDHVRRYLRVSGAEIGWDFVRTAYAAVSRLAVIPLQDLLSLGPEARFNTPARHRATGSGAAARRSSTAWVRARRPTCANSQASMGGSHCPGARGRREASGNGGGILTGVLICQRG